MNQGMITKDTTLKIKGLAILAIILFHSCTMYTWINNRISIFNYAGVANVYLFLLLSGYGMIKGYNKDLTLSSYWEKRWKNTIALYMLVTIVYIMIFQRHLPIFTIMLNVLGMDFSRQVDGTMWYITELFIWYIVFYCVFKLQIRTKYRMILVFVFAFFLSKQSLPSPCDGISWQMRMSAYAFPIGIIVGCIDNKISKLDRRIFLAVATIMGILLITIILKINDWLPICSLLYATIIICIFSYLEKLNIRYSVLSYVGLVSYELYLLEGKTFAVIDLMLWTREMKCFIFVVTIIILSLGIHWGWRYIMGKWLNRDRRTAL